MISYNPKEWFKFVFTFHRADTLRELFPLIVAVGIYAMVVDIVLMDLLHLQKTNFLSKVTYVHTTIGFLFSLLLAFRINSAYDRWWEGRKLWGSLTNNSRNLAIKLKHLVDDPADIAFFNYAIPAFARVLKDSLRDNYKHEEQDFIIINPAKHIPNQVASAIMKRMFELNKSGKLNTEQFLSLNPDISIFSDICGSCERIKKTPIPFSYSVFIKKFIFTYIITLPFAWVFELGYFVVPIICFILFVFASIELIAEEIENPFGADANDLPINTICETIKKDVSDIFY
ncbi:MAG: bestrophin family ion channel [Mucilaginibacter sp.]